MPRIHLTAWRQEEFADTTAAGATGEPASELVPETFAAAVTHELLTNLTVPPARVATEWSIVRRFEVVRIVTRSARR
jgi:hypothetical protein